ncbi:MAG: endolytic transglycosylase MltG [Ruminococcaceae bacterium]|nr:endolytic transglycosylase MltG [Oscillospiraceae bacterium]
MKRWILGFKNTGFGRRNLKSAAVISLSVLVLCVCIWLISAFSDMFGLMPGKGREVMVEIPKGTSVQGISQILKEEGVVRHLFVFRVYEKLGGEHIFQQGGHLVGTGQSYGSVIKKLVSAPEIAENETVTVLIPEGFEAWQIAEKFEQLGMADKDEFLRLLDEGDFDFDFIDEIERTENRLEGYLFPATYEFFAGASEYDIITKMLQAFEDNIVPIYDSVETSYTLDEVVTLASIVEREAANDSERGKVSSVFHNRLRINMTLGSCATVQYIIKERKAVLSNSDIKIKSDYNTYINPGLPVGPIASPGTASVKAALMPEDTDYLYFAARPDGSENVFSRTNEEHIRIVKELQN